MSFQLGEKFKQRQSATGRAIVDLIRCELFQESLPHLNIHVSVKFHLFIHLFNK